MNLNLTLIFYLNCPVLFRDGLWDLNIRPEDLYCRQIVVLRIQVECPLDLDSQDYDLPTIQIFGIDILMPEPRAKQNRTIMIKISVKFRVMSHNSSFLKLQIIYKGAKYFQYLQRDESVSMKNKYDLISLGYINVHCLLFKIVIVSHICN